MQIKGLRNEGVRSAQQARRDQEVTQARRWVHGCWPSDDWNEIGHAIRDAVAAECMVRDKREYQIPLSGKIYDDDTVLDPATGKTKLPPIRVDPRRMGQRHGNRELRLEARRRLYELMLCRPEPSTFFDLQRAIIDDDGKDADGRWLCERCIPHPDFALAAPTQDHEAWPDGSGFDKRLPKWMPRTAALEPVELVEPETVAVVTAPVPPRAFQPPIDGCPECRGPKYGKGFNHADGCSKSTKRVKA